MDLPYYRGLASRHGWGAALGHGAYQVVGKSLRSSVWHVVAATHEEIDACFAADARVSSVRELDAAQLRRFAELPKNRSLRGDAFEAAAARGDRCFAYVDGDLVAHYGWYARGSTRVTDTERDFPLRVDDSWTYLYNCFTDPSARGRQLLGVAVAAACRALRERGSKGILASIALSNFASLKAFRRVGFRRIGWMVQLAGSRTPILTAGCRQHGLHVAEA